MKAETYAPTPEYHAGDRITVAARPGVIVARFPDDAYYWRPDGDELSYYVLERDIVPQAPTEDEAPMSFHEQMTGWAR